MAVVAWLLFAALLSSCRCDEHIADLASQYRFTTQLGDSYHIFWSFNVTTERIDFAVSARTTGWVGFGVSPNGQMPRSDVVIGWVDSNGQAFFHDRFAVGRSTPPIDQEQNWFLIDGMEQNGFTTLRFWRNFTSCDEFDLDIPSGTARVIGSYHGQDPDGDSFIRHTFSQSRSVNLLRGVTEERTVPSDSNSFTVRNTNYQVPMTDTTYYCSIRNLFNLVSDVNTQENPIYLYKVAPLISDANRRFVHHMLVFVCPIDSTINTDGICDEIANSFFGCFGGQIISAWAVGGENYTFPEDVGFPLGGVNRPFKILLEVHYDNPNLTPGIVDSSGIQFFYTKQKPVHEAGGISVAQPIIPLMIIPPNADRFMHSATCLPSCTDQYFPDDGITVFATFLHTHLIGRALNVRHFRRNSECGAMEELPPIDSNPSYDFDFQQLSNLPRSLQIRRGDAIQVQCFYGSSSRDKITTGGESTREEMCQALLYYYPRTDLTNCGSFPEATTAHRPFLERTYPNDPSRINSIINALNADNVTGIRSGFDIDWTPERIQSFQTAMNTARYENEFCSDDRNSSAVSTPVRLAFRSDCSFMEPDRCTSATITPCCERLSGATAVLRSASVLMALMGFLISYTIIFILKA